MTWIITSLSIVGVKGVLDRSGSFQFPKRHGKPCSIAIFGRNGFGKSGYADAIEYLFSSDGEVEHLGKGGVDSEQGGKHAIPHVLAEERKITPLICAEISQLENDNAISIQRPVITGRNDQRPEEIEQIIQHSPAHRILRQHDLRRFVVDMTPGEKFSEFSRWIGLESTAKLLNHITTTENILKETDVDREIKERIQSIITHTSQNINTYNPPEIFDWCTKEIQRFIGGFPPIKTIKELEAAVENLRQRRETLLLQSPVAQLFNTKEQLNSRIQSMLGENGNMEKVKSILPNVIAAEKGEETARAISSQSVFQEVWQSAKTVLSSQNPSSCPVCNTPWEKTKLGSLENVLVNISSSIESLSQYNTVFTELRSQRQSLMHEINAFNPLLSEIRKLCETLSLTKYIPKIESLTREWSEIEQSKQTIRENEKRILDNISSLTSFLREDLQPEVSAIVETRTPQPVTEIDQLVLHINGLIEALSRLEELNRQQSEIRNVEHQFSIIANSIRIECRRNTEIALDGLRGDVEWIYARIHPGDAVPRVFIELDPDRKTLIIRVNFHSEERKVPPGGYLSEAQINTLGLALFLSSVKLFNREFPFLLLDDIVSSYDADCRARIVDVLAEYMEGFQIFLTTHDERFYSHLKQRLEGENWQFEKICGYDFDKGPQRECDNLRPDQINQLIRRGDTRVAGNAVRQYMEEWLDKVSEKYEVHTLHKRESRDYQRTLFDYWTPFLSRVEKIGSGFGKKVINSPQCQRLKGHPIINYYSHYQANPYEWGAMGDVEYIWDNFQRLTSLFLCANCGKELKYDHSDTRVYCTCGGRIFRE